MASQQNKPKLNFILRLILALLSVGIFFAIAMGFKYYFEKIGIYELIFGRIVFTIILVFMIFLGYSLYVKIIEKRNLVEYSKKYVLKELTLGIFIGFGLISFQIFILWILGLYSVIDVVFSSGIIMTLLISVITGFTEELINKGIIFRILEEKLGSWIALIIVGLEVGISHISNAGATTYSTLAVSLEFGIMLALIYMITRRLWVVTGFHFAWNFSMGGIFGQNVSGMDTKGLLVSELKGPSYLTGGTFGIEVGIIAISLALIISILLLIYIVKKKLYLKPFWIKNTSEN